MDFIDEIKQYSKRVSNLKDSLSTEEATKTSLIMPFFALLGYDVFNPEEFVPEYTADVGIKKGEKVDYAILSNGEPVILIECKAVKEELKKHDSQLFRYFGTSKAKFAILTNGIVYRFFTDLDEPNKMDEKPFLEVNMLELRETKINELKKFKKSSFNIDLIMSTASQLKFLNEFKNIFSKDIQEPSDELVSYFSNSVYDGKKTSKVIEKFRPLVKTALNQFISETMNDKLKSAFGEDVSAAETSQLVKQDDKKIPNKAEDTSKSEDTTPKIVTTEEELEAYFIIKNILKEVVPMQDIYYKDNENYMAILYLNKVTKWVCRLYFNGSKKYIKIPDANKNEERIDISNVYDIDKYKTKLIDALKRYM